MIRLSDYSILSDPLPGGGYALMNGYTGAVDLISDDIASILTKVATFRGAQGIPYSPLLRTDQSTEGRVPPDQSDVSSKEQFWDNSSTVE